MSTTADAIMESLRRAGPVCIVCHGSTRHPAIVGDGEPVCYPCILSLGRIAGDPMSADADQLVELELAHADVVGLAACEQHGACWKWMGWA